MAAEYGDYVYNQRLFHLQDEGIIDERELMWDYESQWRYELGSCQIKVRSRAAMLSFCGFVLLTLGGAAIGVNFMPESYSSHPVPGYMVRPMYVTAALMVIGIVLCLGALLMFSSACNKIIFYERGLKYVSFFGFRRQTVMYRDISYIEKYFVRTGKSAFDSYIIHTAGKKYNWTTNDYMGAGTATDLLLYKCFQNVN